MTDAELLNWLDTRRAEIDYCDAPYSDRLMISWTTRRNRLYRIEGRIGKDTLRDCVAKAIAFEAQQESTTLVA